MKSKKAMTVLISISVIFMCCKGTEYLIPTDSDVTAAQARWSGTTMAQLKQGYDIYTDACTNCHGLKSPQKFAETDWIKIMHTMGHKAKLDSTQYYLVLHYILAKRQTVLAGKK